MELDINSRCERIEIGPNVIEQGDDESSGGVENDPRDPEAGGDVVRPAEEEIGEEGGGGVRVGGAPLDYGISEVAEGGHDGDVAVVADVFDVFDGGREGGVGREGQD